MNRLSSIGKGDIAMRLSRMFYTLLAMTCVSWLAAAEITPATGEVSSAKGAKLDLTAWRKLPVFHNGRVMPLDTFARSAVETICGTQSPKLNLVHYFSPEELASADVAEAAVMFPQTKDERGATVAGGEKKFSAAEMLLSWLSEPQRWEDTPFLLAEHEEVRKLLGIPLVSRAGLHLKYVSPAQIEASPAFFEKLQELRRERRMAQSKGDRKFQFQGVNQRFEKLGEAYYLYRQLTQTPSSKSEPKTLFADALDDALTAWSSKPMQEGIAALGMLAGTEHAAADDRSAVEIVSRIEQTLSKLQPLLQDPRFDFREHEAAVVQMVADAEFLQMQFDRLQASSNARSQQLESDAAAMEKWGRVSDRLNEFASLGRVFAKHVRLLRLGLTDHDNAVRVLPSMDADALRTNRDVEDRSNPWLALTTVMQGDDALLSYFSKDALGQVRSEWSRLTESYRNRTLVNRPALVADAASHLALALRNTAQSAESARNGLPNVDAALLAYTKYPAEGGTDTEVRYNVSNPFLGAWVISLLAFVAFSLGFGVLRKPMFLLGLGLMMAGLLWATYGFSMRVAITKFAPVTNMYETVLYVPFFVTALALWMALLPVTWEGIGLGWRLTAIPGTPEQRPMADWASSRVGTAGLGVLAALGVLLRGGIAAGLFWVLTQAPYAAGGRTIINLMPGVQGGTMAASDQTLNNLTVWVVGLTMLAAALYFLPRALTALLFMPVTVPVSQSGKWQGALEQVIKQKPFLSGGAIMAWFLYFIAWYTPVLNKEFSPLMPILRDNFWLTIHVLTIVSSYGAGMLALILAVISLLHFLFGKYRPHPQGGYLPPTECLELANYIYKSMQVAVLLLAAGTVLGGLWADVSWGRFWGWDPKEVWALISLLCYLAILHGRYVGWYGSFGIAVGAVIGATAIAFSWYGVNFFLGVGLHSYGFGAGGQKEVAAIVLALWALVLISWLRCRGKTQGVNEEITGDELANS